MAEGRYRLRCLLRSHTPWVLLDLGLFDEPDKDCGDHSWYNHDDITDHCLYCRVGQRPWAGTYP